MFGVKYIIVGRSKPALEISTPLTVCCVVLCWVARAGNQANHLLYRLTGVRSCSCSCQWPDPTVDERCHHEQCFLVGHSVPLCVCVWVWLLVERLCCCRALAWTRSAIMWRNLLRQPWTAETVTNIGICFPCMTPIWLLESMQYQRQKYKTTSNNLRVCLFVCFVIKYKHFLEVGRA